MGTVAELIIWIAAAALAWAWLAFSDIRSGRIGWSFANVYRADRPTAFWTWFALQHIAIALLFASLMFALT